MTAEFQKGTEIHQFFGDYWNLAKCLWNVSDTDEYWEDVILEMEEFYQKYQSLQDYASSLAVALVSELERRRDLKNGKQI